MASRYTLINGRFSIVGTEPDGDTIRFVPDNPAYVSGLGPVGQQPKFSGGGTQVAVRFEAIDALETHFSGVRQQERLGNLATERMLALLGFSNVVTAGTKIVSADPAAVRGHVLANSLDSYGRVIAFVFAGDGAGQDGGPVFLDLPTLAASINARLLAEGVAYPAFYTTLPVDLKDDLAAQARIVRESAVGIWPEDAPSVDRSASVPSLAAATDLVMWPKLFRRLVAYFKAGNAGLAGFDAWLREDPRNRDDFLMLPTGELGNIHDLVAVEGDTMRLIYRPENIVVLPDSFVEEPLRRPDQPADQPTGQPGNQPTDGPTTDVLKIVAALVNPKGEDTGQESVTILNVSAIAVSLDGWQLSDKALSAAQRPGQALSGTLAPGEALRVALRAPVQLGNAGDELSLVTPQGRVAHRVRYAKTDIAGPGVTLVF